MAAELFGTVVAKLEESGQEILVRRERNEAIPHVAGRR
jgi:hypothetical protein